MGVKMKMIKFNIYVTYNPMEPFIIVVYTF